MKKSIFILNPEKNESIGRMYEFWKAKKCLLLKYSNTSGSFGAYTGLDNILLNVLTE